MFALIAHAAHRNRPELPAVADAADLSAVGGVVVGARRLGAELARVAADLEAGKASAYFTAVISVRP